MISVRWPDKISFSFYFSHLVVFPLELLPPLVHLTGGEECGGDGGDEQQQRGLPAEHCEMRGGMYSLILYPTFI